MITRSRRLSATMATSHFEPLLPKFTGYDAEDPELWLDRYERYGQQKAWTATQQAGNLPLYLADSASYWYRDLPASTTATFASIKQAFLQKYQPHEGMKWVRLAELADRKQQPNESVEAYVADIERRCCQLRKSPEERMEVCVRGLLPDIRNYVIKSHPKTVDEAITQARLAQSTSVQSPPILEVNSAIKELTNQITALQSQLATISATQPAPYTEQTPNRGYYDDRRRQQFRPQPRHFVQRGQQDRQPTPPMMTTACHWCGRGECSRQTCPARNIECHNCHKVGHFARVCLSRPGNYNNSNGSYYNQ